MKYGVGWWNFNRNLNFEVVPQHRLNAVSSSNAAQLIHGSTVRNS